MAVAGCTTIDATLTPIPVSPAQAEAAPNAVVDSSGPASFLAAFGQAVETAVWEEQQTAVPAQAGAQPASRTLVPAALPVGSEQPLLAAEPTTGQAVDMPAQEALPPVREAADCAQPRVFVHPVILAQVSADLAVGSEPPLPAAEPATGRAVDVPAQEALLPVREAADCAQPRVIIRPANLSQIPAALPVGSELPSSAAEPTIGQAADVPAEQAVPLSTETVDRAQSLVFARRASGEPDGDRPAGPGQTAPAEACAPYACAMPAERSRITDLDLSRAGPRQARPGRSEPAEHFFRISGADARLETAESEKPEAVSATAECSTRRAGDRGQSQVPENDGVAPVKPPAAEPCDLDKGAAADSGTVTARSVADPRYLPDRPSSTEACGSSSRPAPDSLMPTRDIPDVGTACELSRAWRSVPWVTAGGGVKGSTGLREAFEGLAQAPGQPVRPGLPYLPPSPDKLLAAERGREAWVGFFRPVLLLETVSSLPANARPAAQAGNTEALAQADSTPLAPAAPPEKASDSFARASAESQQPLPPDPASQTTLSAPSGRSAGTYSFAPDVARLASGGSTFADTAASGFAGGAAQHFSLQGRPVEAPAITQPSSSLVSANADDLYLRLAEQMRLQVREGKSSVRIQLKPEALGRLEIKAETGPAGLTATITAETHGVKAFLEQNLHSLYRTLQDMGLKVDRILVTEDGSQHRAPGQPNDGEGHSGQGRSHPADEPSWLPGAAAARTDQLPAAPAMPAYWLPHSTFHAVA